MFQVIRKRIQERCELSTRSRGPMKNIYPVFNRKIASVSKGLVGASRNLICLIIIDMSTKKDVGKLILLRGKIFFS